MSRKRRKRKSGNHQENIEVVYNTKDDRDTEERLTDSEATDGSENLEETAELNISEETDEPEIERENEAEANADADEAEGEGEAVDEEPGEEDGSEDSEDEEVSETMTEEEDPEEEEFRHESDTEEDEGTDETDEDDSEDEEDEDVQSGDKKKRRRRRRGRRKKKERKPLGKKFWIILGSIFGGLIAIYLGISIYFIGHFFVNTTINGKDFSGSSAAVVEEYFKEQVKDYELTIVELNNETDVIKGSEISLSYKENTGVKKALKEQNPLLWVTAFFSKTSKDVQVQVNYDEKVLEEKIQSIKAVTQEQTEPASAYPKFDGESFVVEPEVYGTAVNLEVLTEKIKEYISAFEPKLDMFDEGCYKLPKYLSDSPEVQAACDTMNEYCKASITYTMTENVVVDKTVISGWLTYDENMKVSLDENAVREWMRTFGQTYDTVGAYRTITTPTGKAAEVSGGTYGWSIDEETETQNLIASINNGEVATREPAYEQTAASHAAQDWGSTYLEVDLSAQHMWYIVDGAVALETDVVTGIPTPDRITPAGVYSILEMKRNKTLVGTINPSTGEPIYETPVRYWMRVTWTGIGFHDADWQSSFGGTRYQTSAGSHGCINMPVSKAGELYGMLSMGTPVIIHY